MAGNDELRPLACTEIGAVAVYPVFTGQGVTYPMVFSPPRAPAKACTGKVTAIAAAITTAAIPAIFFFIFFSPSICFLYSGPADRAVFSYRHILSGGNAQVCHRLQVIGAGLKTQMSFTQPYCSE